MTGNPLIAVRQEPPVEAWTGLWLAEDLEAVHQGYLRGSWLQMGLGGTATALDALAFYADPFSSVLQYAVSWLIEHIRPLRQALDVLAGDPAQIRAHAETWRNVATSLRGQARELGASVRRNVASWEGKAGPYYRGWAERQEAAVGGLAETAEVTATLTEVAGVVAGAVRQMIRDTIAVLVSRLITYAGAAIFSVGLATPYIVWQVTNLVAVFAARIADLLRGLVGSFRQFDVLSRRLGEIIEQLREWVRRLFTGTKPPEPPKPEPERGRGPKPEGGWIFRPPTHNAHGAPLPVDNISVGELLRFHRGDIKAHIRKTDDMPQPDKDAIDESVDRLKTLRGLDYEDLIMSVFDPGDFSHIKVKQFPGEKEIDGGSWVGVVDTGNHRLEVLAELVAKGEINPNQRLYAVVEKVPTYDDFLERMWREKWGKK